MASEYTKDPLRGLLIADERGAIWAAESSYTEAGPRAGVPVPTGVTHMVATAWGDQTADTTIEVQTMRAGVARANPALAAAYVYRSATSGAHWGWDAPATLARFEQVIDADTGGGDEHYAKDPDAVALPDGVVVAVSHVFDDGAASKNQVRVSVRAVAGTWTHVNVYTTTFNVPTDQGYYPAILRLPSGRLLVYHWVFDPVLLEANIRCHASDDDGATWSVVQQYAVDDPIPYGPDSGKGNGIDKYQVGRIRAAYSLGQVLVMADITHNDTEDTYRSKMVQLGSLDLGMTLERVEIWDADTEGPVGLDIIATETGYLIVYVAGTGSTGAATNAPLTSILLGSAFESSEGATHTAITGPTFSRFAGVKGTDDITVSRGVVLTRDGETVYCHYIVEATSGTVDYGAALYTTDNGGTWAGLYGGAGKSVAAKWIDPQQADKYPLALTGCQARGTTFIFSNASGQPATDQSLMCHYLGGYSTVTMPGIARWLEPGRRAGHSQTWVPYDVPGSLGWSAAGAGTNTLASGYLEVVTTAGQSEDFTVVPTTTLVQGLLVSLSVQQVSGGGLGLQTIACRMLLDDAAHGYEIRIQFSATGFRILDITASGVVGTVTVDTATTGVDLIVSLGNGASSPGNNGKLQTWYRLRGPDTERTWTAGPTSSTLQDIAGGGGGANSLEWGCLGNGAATSRWYRFLYTEGAETGINLYDGQTNPDDLHPHPYSAIYGTQIDKGVTLRGESGPTVRGDVFTVATRYDYAVGRILPSSGRMSPRWGWRSTSTAAQTIALQMSDQGDTSFGSDIVGIAAFGSNVSRVQVEAYDLGTTSWIAIKTVNIYSGLSGLRWDRAGTSVTVNTGGASTDNPYLHHEEVAGSTFAFTDAVARRIAHNAEGKWTDSAARRPVLQLEGIDGTEGTTGAGYIIPKDWVILVDLKGVHYSGLRIIIPTPTTSVPAPAEAYWEIGTLVVGPVVLHGDESGWGRTVDIEQGSELTEARDGTRRAFDPAPARRVWEYGWAYGLDTTDSTNPAGDPDPDYIEASAEAAALAVASRRDTPWQVEGLVRRIAGSKNPVVYLPRVGKFEVNEDARILNRRWQMGLGRVTSDVAIESVQGDELENEVVRIAVLRIEEEV